MDASRSHLRARRNLQTEDSEALKLGVPCALRKRAHTYCKLHRVAPDCRGPFLRSGVEIQPSVRLRNRRRDGGVATHKLPEFLDQVLLARVKMAWSARHGVSRHLHLYLLFAQPRSFGGVALVRLCAEHVVVRLRGRTVGCSRALKGLERENRRSDYAQLPIEDLE